MGVDSLLSRRRVEQKVCECSWEGVLGGGGAHAVNAVGAGQVAVLLEEKGSLAEENRALREEKAQLEADAAGAASKKLQLLQAQVEELQEENYRWVPGGEGGAQGPHGTLIV